MVPTEIPVSANPSSACHACKLVLRVTHRSSNRSSSCSFCPLSNFFSHCMSFCNCLVPSRRKSEMALGFGSPCFPPSPLIRLSILCQRLLTLTAAALPLLLFPDVPYSFPASTPPDDASQTPQPTPSPLAPCLIGGREGSGSPLSSERGMACRLTG